MIHVNLHVEFQINFVLSTCMLISSIVLICLVSTILSKQYSSLFC